jgi:hypothetical protein
VAGVRVSEPPLRDRNQGVFSAAPHRRLPMSLLLSSSFPGETEHTAQHTIIVNHTMYDGVYDTTHGPTLARPSPEAIFGRRGFFFAISFPPPPHPVCENLSLIYPPSLSVFLEPEDRLHGIVCCYTRVRIVYVHHTYKDSGLDLGSWRGRGFWLGKEAKGRGGGGRDGEGWPSAECGYFLLFADWVRISVFLQPLFHFIHP